MKNLITLVLLLFAFAGSALAQQVKGVVKDNTGELLPGVSILIKGTTTGVSTDMDGKFTLSVPDLSKAVLKITFMGMKTQEVAVKGQTSLNIVMESESSMLDEVVAIGYGTSRKRDITGSVASVGAESLSKLPVTSTAAALTGRVAGLQVTTADGSPDAEVIIRVRGGGSVTGDNSPLYIVDGFPMSSMSDIAPGDIESIDILKDASSTAIYGAQGANGVVIITTKSAKDGKTQVTYNGYMQTKKIANRLDVLDAYEYVKLCYEYGALQGTDGIKSYNNTFGLYEDMDLYKYQKPIDSQDDLFGADVVSQSHNISVSTATEKTKYFFSVTYDKNGGLMKNNDFSRYSFNLKTDTKISDAFRFKLNARMVDTETNGSGTSGDTYKIRSSEAVTSMRVTGLSGMKQVDPTSLDEDEYEEWLKNNMTLEERAAEYWKRKNNRSFNIAGTLEWKIMKGLTYTLEGGYDWGFNEVKNWWGKNTNNATYAGGLPLADWTKKNSTKLRVANTLKYDFKLMDHSFSILAGQEVVNTGANQNYMYATGFGEDLSPEKVFANYALASGSLKTTSSESPDDRLTSFFGRFNYSLKDRYLFTFTFRADGSSKFADGNRWGYFPAAAIAWRVSEEDFIKQFDFISNLKLRLSYGQVGNNRIGNTQYKLDYAINANKTYGQGDVANNYYSATNSQLANPNLKWETTITRNLGLDFGLWHEKLSGTIDAYYNSTKDLLLESKIVAPGYSSQYQNIGETSNKGIELTLNGYIIEKKNFTLSANFNIGVNKPKVESLMDGVQYQEYASGWAGTDLKGYYDYRVEVGQPVGLIYGFQTDGYYSVDDFEYWNSANDYALKPGVPTTGLLGGTVGIRPGTVKLKDLSGADGKPDGIVDADYDRKVIGKTNPKFFGGFGVNTTFYGFDLSLMFNYVYGNKIYNANKIASSQKYRTNWPNMLSFMKESNRYSYIDGAGKVVTDLEQLRAMNETGSNKKAYWSPWSFGNAVAVPHSWAVEDGSFLRLQNVTLGYTLPRELTRKFYCQSFRFYCTLNNVYCWTNYSGYDPEVSTAGRNSSVSGLTPGVDYSSYPKSFSCTFGVNVTF